ncbi:MAG: threonine synthase [Gemmatimonadetes bacterium]|nr:threonine synthase [Gemmatimonadota bacterium]
MSGYTTTRGGRAVPLKEAILRGLGPEGGLYVPVAIPMLPNTEVPPAPGMLTSPDGDGFDTLLRIAKWAAPALFPGVPRATVTRVVERSLTFPIPLVEVEAGRFVLELFHGPTHAFKDVGARFMAALMEEVDEGEPASRIVLVATSGDTGGAVADAFRGLAGTSVVVLFPVDGISARQRRQMTTLGENVHALAVRGTFDDCQRLVKEAFLSTTESVAHRLTSANSINVARLLPQILYYVYAAHVVPRPRFVVPSGNLGNLCAGLMAMRAGVQTTGFIAAANANRGFIDFLNGADFESRASVTTSSNAMDVGSPSNLERLLWLYGGDAHALRRDVTGVSVSDESATECIADVYRATGYILDPHSAVAYEAARRHDAPSNEALVILATAHPAKFPESVEDVIGRAIPVPPDLAALEHRAERMETIAPTLAALLVELEKAST